MMTMCKRSKMHSVVGPGIDIVVLRWSRLMLSHQSLRSSPNVNLSAVAMMSRGVVVDRRKVPSRRTAFLFS
jgi:hypothetical protein